MKSVQIQSYFWSVFSCIRTEYRKIRTRNNSVFEHFSRSSTHYQRPPLVQGGVEISCVVNTKLIDTKNIKKSLQRIWKWFKLIIQNRHLMKMLSWVPSWLCLLMKMQTLQTVKTAPNVPIKEGGTNH